MNEPLQTVALEVPYPDDSFDPTTVPQNGIEYLMSVIYERDRCPGTVVKPLNQAQPKVNTNIQFDLPNVTMSKTFCYLGIVLN